jgi:glycosyltransferase involved in cell wall biosynthesis
MSLNLSLIIPCYNEATHLRESVAALLRTLDGSRLEYEVVFVEDCSQDSTRQIVQEICAQEARCRAIYHEQNRGRGAAFKTGFKASEGPVAGFIDIDLEIDPLYIPALVALIQEDGYDVASGHRFYLVRQTRALIRHILSVGYRWLYRRVLGVTVKDSETGCKFFRRETATGVVLGSLNDGWFWDTEVMARAELTGLKIIEMPVLFLRHREKPSSVNVLSDCWQYLIDLQRFRSLIRSEAKDRNRS